MSVRSIGARAVLTAIGVLVSLAVIAAPSWAAKGNSANAKLCEAGGYPGVLLAQDGSAFKNEGKCTSYAAKGGQIAGVNAVAGPVSGGFFNASYSGFGLKPESSTLNCDRYFPSGVTLCFGSSTVAGDGTFAGSGEEFPCTENFGFGPETVGSLVVEAETAGGIRFIRDLPGKPSGC